MIEILKETVVFNGIDEKTIKNILEKNKYEIKKYSPNESIAFRGDEVRGLYIILKGTLSRNTFYRKKRIFKNIIFKRKNFRKFLKWSFK